MQITEALRSIVISPSTSEVSSEISENTEETSSQPLQEQQLPDGRSTKSFLFPVFLVFLVLLLIVGIGASFWGFTIIRRNHEATLAGRSTSSPIAHPTPTVTATAPSAPNPYPLLAASYSGTIDDLQANVPSPMTLSQVRQNDRHISGSLSALRMSGTYNGYLDTAKHIYFTVTDSGGSASLSFTGAVRADGSLAGTFCQIDQGGSCMSNGIFGVWNVAPVTPPRK